MENKSTAIRDVFATVSFGAPEKAVGFVLWRIVHRYMREVDRALVALDLTHLQFMTLALVAWLGRMDAPVTQSDVAANGDIHPMQVSLMLKALENKGLVLRKRNTADVRVKHLALTTEGIALLRQSLPVVVTVQKTLFGELADVDGDFLKTLMRLDLGSAGATG